MATLLRLFGAPTFEGPHRVELPTHRPVWLLLVLAYRGAWIGRDELLTLFWPEAGEAAARHGLRLWISRAKAFWWAEGLEIERRRLRWAPPTDVAAFRAALGRGAWVEALDWYRAPLLAGVTPPDIPTLDEWLGSEREALQGAVRQASVQAARLLTGRGDHHGAAELLRSVLVHDPLAEGVLVAYMEQAARAGHRDEALRRYGRFTALLRTELGAAPLEATQRLAARIERAGSRPEDDVAPSRPPALPPEMTYPPVMIGRDEAARRVAAASRRLTLVTGEPGVGKSRLLEETVLDAVWLRCREATSDVPLYPVVDYVRSVPDAVAALGPYARDVASVVPEVDGGDAPAPAATGIAKTRLFEGLARLVEAAAAMLVVEDLHWADDLTLELLGLLVVRGRVRVIATRRSGRMPADWQQRLGAFRAAGFVEEVRLERLDEAGVQDMLAVMIGVDRGPPRFAAWLHARTAGNPLFVVETLKMLVERGSLDVALDRWPTQLDALTCDDTDLAVPAGVLDLIRQRADEVSGAALRVLEIASVAGEFWDPDTLGSVIGTTAWEVVAALEELEAHGLADGRAFSHDLVGSAVYERLSSVRRAHLHGIVAKAIEGGHDPFLVAEHWLRARKPQRAAAQFLAAAGRAAARGWWPQAHTAVARSLELAPGPEAEHLLAEILLATGAVDAADPYIDALLEEGERFWQVRAQVLRSQQEIQRGRLERAQAAARTAADVARGLSAEVELEALLALSAVAALSGTQAEVIERLEEFVTHMPPGVTPRLRVQALSNLAWLHAGLRRFERALALYRDGAAEAEAAGDGYWAVWVAANTLYCCLELGQPEAALAEAERHLSDELTDAHEILRINVAKGYLDLGRQGEALALLETVRETSVNPSNLAVALGYLVDLYARTGAVVESRTALVQALDLLPATDVDRARVRVAIAALWYGDDGQRALVADAVSSVREGGVPGYVWREFEAARRDRCMPAPSIEAACGWRWIGHLDAADADRLQTETDAVVDPSW